MRASSVSAPWSARSLCLLAVLSCSLTACKPSLPQVLSKPDPPTVACELPATDDPPEAPILWLIGGPEWARQVLGLLTESIDLRAAEHGCLQGLRERGVIK